MLQLRDLCIGILHFEGQGTTVVAAAILVRHAQGGPRGGGLQRQAALRVDDALAPLDQRLPQLSVPTGVQRRAHGEGIHQPRREEEGREAHHAPEHRVVPDRKLVPGERRGQEREEHEELHHHDDQEEEDKRRYGPLLVVFPKVQGELPQVVPQRRLRVVQRQAPLPEAGAVAGEQPADLLLEEKLPLERDGAALEDHTDH
mmetsp:Transcript_57935/g.167978  ORF Transcript_57935/g.167978 Transcript_57935/m.167978 type:complete len:201 (+) Transcript_57935:243-845(+)